MWYKCLLYQYSGDRNRRIELKPTIWNWLNTFPYNIEDKIGNREREREREREGGKQRERELVVTPHKLLESYWLSAFHFLFLFLPLCNDMLWSGFYFLFHDSFVEYFTPVGFLMFFFSCKHLITLCELVRVCQTSSTSNVQMFGFRSCTLLQFFWFILYSFFSISQMKW